MNNSEILYLYDAKLTNPNGDPDEENRPRMDYEREINLVSDLRMKRYIRDYLLDSGKRLFVQSIDGAPVTAAQRVSGKSEDDILKEMIDVRMFGATMPIKGDNKAFIGPIQFNWGYSLNKVELMESSITSHFSSESGNKQGAIGKDYRVKYSFIAFSAVISGKRAERTRLSDEDIDLFDKSMRYAIPLQTTRSKIGQYPRLYLRVEYKDDETIFGDMRDYVKLNEKVDSIRDINECSLEISKLVEFLNENKGRISKVIYYHDPKLELLISEKKVVLKEILKDLNIAEVK